MTEIECEVLEAVETLKYVLGSDLTLENIEAYCEFRTKYSRSDASAAFQSLCSKGAIKVTNRMEIEIP
jgi:hypothetical protein